MNDFENWLSTWGADWTAAIGWVAMMAFLYVYGIDILVAILGAPHV